MSVTKIAFVGHIDHGKSTLCGRLLAESGAVPPDKLDDVRKACQGKGGVIDYAFCMDAFCEEREGLLTIDITQIPVRIAGRNYLVIDTPGHAEFIRNMITGACQADAAILVVDAVEGIAGQTRRHAAILSFLGINQCVVAINKMDLIGYNEHDFYKLKHNVEELMASLGITPLHIIPLSAMQGDNLVDRSNAMPWYIGNTLVEALTGLHAAEESSKDLRVAIQDVYSSDCPPSLENHLACDGIVQAEGVASRCHKEEGGSKLRRVSQGGHMVCQRKLLKKIAAVRVEAGYVRQGMKVMVEPDHVELCLSDIIKYPHSVKSAKSGDCIGLVMDDNSFLKRGQILCNPESMPHVTNHIWANLIWLSETPFKFGMNLTLKLLTQESGCCIAQIKQRMDSSTLENEATEDQILCLSDIGHVLIETEKRLFWDTFNHIPAMGRFVLESDGRLVGAGTIIENVQ